MPTPTLTQPTSHALGIAPGEAILAVNAHGDDEAMTQAQTLIDLVAEGTSFYAATVSDGEQNGDPLVRRQEANAAYDHYGVQPENRFYFGLPDSELHRKPAIMAMAKQLGGIATTHHVTTLITPGWEGFDGHSDHRGVHLAGMLAAALFVDHEVSVLALDPEGDQAVPVDTGQKLAALALYHSQFRGQHEEVARQHYPHFLQHETYTRLDPHAHLDRTLEELMQIQQYIPRV